MACLDENIKNSLDTLLDTYKVQPVGWGYIDCIIMKEDVTGFVQSLTELGIRILCFSWWCHCLIGGNKDTGCPHGGGGPISKYYQGYFSEMYQLPYVEIQDNDEVMPYIFNEWPKKKEYLPCLIPGFWLDVPDNWRNIVERS